MRLLQRRDVLSVRSIQGNFQLALLGLLQILDRICKQSTANMYQVLVHVVRPC